MPTISKDCEQVPRSPCTTPTPQRDATATVGHLNEQEAALTAVLLARTVLDLASGKGFISLQEVAEGGATDSEEIIPRF